MQPVTGGVGGVNRTERREGESHFLSARAVPGEARRCQIGPSPEPALRMLPARGQRPPASDDSSLPFRAPANERGGPRPADQTRNEGRPRCRSRAAVPVGGRVGGGEGQSGSVFVRLFVCLFVLGIVSRLFSRLPSVRRPRDLLFRRFRLAQRGEKERPRSFWGFLHAHALCALRSAGYS